MDRDFLSGMSPPNEAVACTLMCLIADLIKAGVLDRAAVDQWPGRLKSGAGDGDAAELARLMRSILPGRKPPA